MAIELRTVAETASTNDDMVALAAAGAAEGLWLRAVRQTAGRGRQGRAWSAPSGNLSASTLVRLYPNDPPAPTLALVAAVALAEAVAVFGVQPRIKWPNDLLVEGAKLSGILLERAGDAVVIGFGVNLAHHPDDLDRPATSIAAVAGHAPDPDIVMATLAESFARWIGRWRGRGSAPSAPAGWIWHTPSAARFRRICRMAAGSKVCSRGWMRPAR